MSIITNEVNEVNEEKVESCVDDLFSKLTEQFNDSQSILKTLSNNLKILHKEVIKERKEIAKKAKKNKKNKNKKTVASGFAKPSLISPVLCTFLNIEENSLMPRTEVTKLILKYVKDNNLQNPKNKTQIIPDDKLKKIIEPSFNPEEDILKYFNLQTYIKDHFKKVEPKDTTEN